MRALCQKESVLNVGVLSLSLSLSLSPPSALSTLWSFSAMMLFILLRNSVGCLVGSLGWLATMVHFFSTGIAWRVFLRSSDKCIVFYIRKLGGISVWVYCYVQQAATTTLTHPLQHKPSHCHIWISPQSITTHNKHTCMHTHAEWLLLRTYVDKGAVSVYTSG